MVLHVAEAQEIEPVVRPEKAELVKEIKNRLSSAEIALLADYRGLNAHEMTELRRKLRESGVDFKIFKNTLMRIAARESDLSELEQFLTGPTAVAFGLNDPVAASKLLAKFAEEHEALEIKGGLLEGEVIPAEHVSRLAALPSREELAAKLVGAVRAPIYRLVNAMSSPIRGLVSVLGQAKNRSGQ